MRAETGHARQKHSLQIKGYEKREDCCKIKKVRIWYQKLLRENEKV